MSIRHPTTRPTWPWRCLVHLPSPSSSHPRQHLSHFVCYLGRHTARNEGCRYCTCARLWDLTGARWRIFPSEQPMAEKIGPYLYCNAHTLSCALEEAEKVISERICDPMTTPSLIPSEPLLPGLARHVVLPDTTGTSKTVKYTTTTPTTPIPVPLHPERRGMLLSTKENGIRSQPKPNRSGAGCYSQPIQFLALSKVGALMRAPLRCKRPVF